MRDVLTRVPVLLRVPLAVIVFLALSGAAAALLPDGWPLWAYMAFGAPFGLAGAIVGTRWMDRGNGDA